MDLNGKNIVITGASSGIGEATLRELLTYDVNIIAANRNVANAPVSDSKVKWFQCDISDPSQIDKLFEFAIEQFGHIDIFIANAGFAYYEVMQQEDWGRLEAIVKTNFVSPVYSAVKMARLNQGREYTFVFTASAMAHLPIPGYSTYAATKAAIDKFAYAYRIENNDQGHLLVVYPIATRTDFFNRAGNNTPVPWPSQPADVVGKAIVNGIEKNRKKVYPSKLFILMLFVNRFLPFSLDIYAQVEAFKLRRWLRKQTQSHQV
ncbi:MAG: SDR family NAD(P)-dependent oxidoreductase [Pseudomonadales bacterium]|nr:SDR family NAD(P)-dependent oxidoreductase [Pseudomonadales bacterium]